MKVEKTKHMGISRKELNIQTVNILGVNIAAIDMDRLLALTPRLVSDFPGRYICVTNVYADVLAFKEPDYQKIQNEALLALPDGSPLAVVGRKRGYDISRVAGPDYMGRVLGSGGEYRHFFYGSTQETLDKMKTKLLEKYSELQIAGMYSPPFRPVTEEEDQEIIRMINETGPDFVWVGLGAPKQERWMAEHQGKVHGLMVGVGAAFDYTAGNIKRAPLWMQKANLEWFYRWLQEPVRLFKRYVTSNFRFIWHAVIRGR